MSGVAIAGIPESIWVTIRGRTGEWGSQAHCSNCNWSEGGARIGRVDQRSLSTREPGPHSYTAAILSEAVRRLTAGVAHDFNTLLMSIGGSGRVDRDAAFFRSGLRPVTVMQSQVDDPCGDPNPATRFATDIRHAVYPRGTATPQSTSVDNSALLDQIEQDVEARHGNWKKISRR